MLQFSRARRAALASVSVFVLVIALAGPALESGQPVQIEVPIRNVNRTVGAMLSGEVAKAYDVFFDKAGMALRGTFLVDVDGVIRFAEANGPGEARDQAAWKRAVAALPAHSS